MRISISGAVSLSASTTALVCVSASLLPRVADRNRAGHALLRRYSSSPKSWRAD